MNDGLLVVERIVLESLAKKERNFEELVIDTGLNHVLLNNVVPLLMMKNMILLKKGSYFLNEQTKDKWITVINSSDNIKEEVKELFISLVNRYFSEEREDSLLKVKKVWLTPMEDKILNAHLYNLETYISNLEKEKRGVSNKNRLCEKRVIVWGHSKYLNLVDEILQAV